jgi:cold shock CspA family protein
MNGRVKAIKSKGFGFISTEIGIEFFFHQHACKDDATWRDLLKRFALGERPKVKFDQDKDSNRGPRAINVTCTED